MKTAYNKFIQTLVFTVANYVYFYTGIYYVWLKKNVRKLLPKSKQYEI